MMRKPTPVADAIRTNSFLSGFVHFLTRWTESLTNCFSGCTITALTSDILQSLEIERAISDSNVYLRSAQWTRLS